ncbi:MAG: glycosyltransferase [Pseudomonadales bacterium]|jgi:glycosyltransferase involved in cell wall biosynthesis|nr:glycosyltransferase [Pseudomonadales bacterium]
MKNYLLNKKVAIVYDWADINYGGAEKVLLALQKLFPDATFFTSVANFSKAKWLKKFKRVETSFLQSWPNFIKKNRSLCSVFLPYSFESFNFDGFDLVISVSSFAAKGVITKPNQLHICYLLTPTRFLYSHQAEYLGQTKFKIFPGRQIAKLVAKYLTSWDQVAARRPDYIIPISKLVAKRVGKYYELETLPSIYPPCAENCAENNKKEDFFLSVCRLVDYKKVDLAIKAAILTDTKLKIVGDGPNKKKYQKLVRKLNGEHLIDFLGQISDKELELLYNKARALLFIGEEDFGITALEANAQGTIVIGNNQSGAMEILPKSGKVELANLEVETIAQAIREVRTDESNIRPKCIVADYNEQQFIDNFKKQLNELWKNNYEL